MCDMRLITICSSSGLRKSGTHLSGWFEVGRAVRFDWIVPLRRVLSSAIKMITKFITEVKTVFNPFSATAKHARLFISSLPSNARKTMSIETKVLPKASKEPSHLYVKFKDGKELNLHPDTIGLQGIFEEVDRHSRILLRKEELGG